MKGGKINALEVSVELKECWVKVEQESRNDKKRKWLESRLSKIEITGGCDYRPTTKSTAEPKVTSKQWHCWHFGSDMFCHGGRILCTLGCWAIFLDATTLDARSTHTTNGNNQKRLQTSPNVPWGQKSPLIENQCSRVRPQQSVNETEQKSR